jgi:hypothetical protein
MCLQIMPSKRHIFRDTLIFKPSLSACFDAGMSAEAVRPQREPTGSQQRRNNIKRVQKMSKSNINSVQIKHSPISFEIAESVEPELPRNNQAEFNRLVDLYTEHLKFMNRSLITTEDFLTELTSVRHFYCLSKQSIFRVLNMQYLAHPILTNLRQLNSEDLFIGLRNWNLMADYHLKTESLYLSAILCENWL